MTLAFTEQARGSMGEKSFRASLVTLDGSTTDINASDLDLHYIISAMVTAVSVASNIASYLETTAGATISLGTTHAADDTINLWVWGF